MNFKNIIKSITKTDAEVCSQISDRRQALKNFGSNIAAAALPISLSSIFHNTPDKLTVLESLNHALQLEYLEYSFYRTANAAMGLIPVEYAAGFKAIEAHEKAHVEFLTKAISDLGGTPFTPAAQHDFTHGGVYPAFSDYATFLITAQAIEDAGLRAHTTLLENLAGSKLFAQVQQMVSTEARHAAHSRMIRREMHVENVPAHYMVNNFAAATVNHKNNHSAKSRHAHLGVA